MTTTFSFRCSEEQKQRLNDMLQGCTTGEEKADFLIKNAVNSVNADRHSKNAERLQAANTGLHTEIERLQNVNSELQSANSRLQEDYKLLQTAFTDEQNANAALRGTTEELQKTLSTQSSRPENEICFAVPEPANSLLKEYAKRLGVEPSAILIDMFVRYVTEQYNRWFFDFLVKKSEFKDVCGFTHAEVQQWLNAQKQGGQGDE